MQLPLLLLACCLCSAYGAADRRRQDPLGVLAWINSELLPREMLLRLSAAPTTAIGSGRNGFSHQWHRHRHHHHRLGVHSPNLAVVQQQHRGSNSLKVQLDPSSSSARPVPRGFLGLSHEWNGLSDMTASCYHKLLQDLAGYGDAPLVLRIGGGSTDRRADGVVSQATWATLRELHSNVPGLVFIPGINLERLDPRLSREQLQAARTNLPQGSILSVELGNEPNYYDNMHNMSTNSWLASGGFVGDWRAMAQQLCCGRPAADEGSCGGVAGDGLAGPAWGHVYMRNTTLDWFLRVNNACINLVTVHWYKATSQEHTTVETLLDEAPLRAAMASLKSLVETSNRWGKPLRVAEVNSISNAGLLHVSNTLAAALWSLDGAFEAAVAGATGVNLHQGDGTTIYAALWRTNSSAAVRIKPAFYAMLLFKMAVRHGVSLLPWASPQTEDGPVPGSAARLKVWALRDDSSLRFVLINKAASEAGAVTIQLQQAAGYHRLGKLIRLIGPADGLASEWQVTLAGMRYQTNGSPVGTAAGEVVHSHWEAAGTTFAVQMPPASAALLVIPAARRERAASAADVDVVMLSSEQ